MKLELDTTSLADVRAALCMLDALNDFLVARGIEKTSAAIVAEKPPTVIAKPIPPVALAPVARPTNGHAEEPDDDEDNELDFEPYDRQIMKNCAASPHPKAEELDRLLKIRGRGVTASVKRQQYELTKEILGSSRPEPEEDKPLEGETAESLVEVLKQREQESTASEEFVQTHIEPKVGPALPDFLTLRPAASQTKSLDELRNELESYATSLRDEKGGVLATRWWVNAIEGRQKGEHTQLTAEDITYILANPAEFMPAV